MIIIIIRVIIINGIVGASRPPPKEIVSKGRIWAVICGIIRKIMLPSRGDD
jgi:hypothetical protein